MMITLTLTIRVTIDYPILSILHMDSILMMITLTLTIRVTIDYPMLSILHMDSILNIE